MKDAKAEILALLQTGPRRRRELLAGRQGSFRAAYAQLRRSGSIEERVSPLSISRNEPLWTCLPDQVVPAPIIHRAKAADIRALMRIGWSRPKAVRAIYDCKDYDGLAELLGWAATQISWNPADPPRRGRPRKKIS